MSAGRWLRRTHAHAAGSDLKEKVMAIPTTRPSSTVPGLEGTTFELADGAVRRRLIISVEGDWGTGKTDFALTAPGPIAFFNFDLNTEWTLGQYAKKKQIYKSNISIPDKDDRDAQTLAETAWKRFKNDYMKAVA